MAVEDMEMVPVTSTQIAAVGYDADTKKMRIEFNNGSLYEYSNVTQEIFDGIVNAASPGGAFTASVKGNPKYPYVRLS
jgi:KTSC domain